MEGPTNHGHDNIGMWSKTTLIPLFRDRAGDITIFCLALRYVEPLPLYASNMTVSIFTNTVVTYTNANAFLQGMGKSRMILDAMHSVAADGVVMCDVHPDLEVFRIRLGEAINFDYDEDLNITIFKRRTSRNGGLISDIERALKMLETIALELVKKRRKPLVLVFNNIHYFKNNDIGNDMLLLLQQKAEAWATSGMLLVYTQIVD
jgi:hypothetical protein